MPPAGPVHISLDGSQGSDSSLLLWRSDSHLKRKAGQRFSREATLVVVGTAVPVAGERDSVVGREQLRLNQGRRRTRVRHRPAEGRTG